MSHTAQPTDTAHPDPGTPTAPGTPTGPRPQPPSMAATATIAHLMTTHPRTMGSRRSPGRC